MRAAKSPICQAGRGWGRCPRHGATRVCGTTGVGISLVKLKGERDSGRGNRNPTLKSARATPKLENFGITRDQAIEIDESDELFPKGEFEAALELLPKLVPS